MPDQDCCSLFTPRNPATRADLEQVRAAEALLDVEALIREALGGTSVEERRFPPRQRADGRADQLENDKIRRSLAQEIPR